MKIKIHAEHKCNTYCPHCDNFIPEETEENIKTKFMDIERPGRVSQEGRFINPEDMISKRIEYLEENEDGEIILTLED